MEEGLLVSQMHRPFESNIRTGVFRIICIILERFASFDLNEHKIRSFAPFDVASNGGNLVKR